MNKDSLGKNKSKSINEIGTKVLRYIKLLILLNGEV